MSSQEKKSIYDTHEREYPVSSPTQQPTRLQHLMRQLRNDTREAAETVQARGQLVVQHWIMLEQHIARVVRNTVPSGEKLAPGILYVGVAALAGPIFTRKRNFAVRWTSPLLFGAAAAAYWLPGTAQVVLRNVWARYGDPTTIDRVAEMWSEVRQKRREAVRSVQEGVQELRMSLQEGREFGKKKTGEAVSVAVAAAKEEAEAVATKVQAQTQKASEAVTKVLDQIPAAAKDEKPKKSLPLGFKDSAE
ncbi:hypothetical protein LPJ53_002435 [Coemansia erecta]|uniref:MICOS complex subunit n=1 Tax=Coemansia erecta TaxID=147472 RepID=A0A9W8CTI9_9FUNG|nr:hypothetical protein LPJ53_002435 [Coemansia erecta]